MRRWTVSSTAVTAVLVLAGLSIGSFIDRRVPSSDDVLSEPFVHPVAMGETAHLRTGELTAVRVETARTVSDGFATRHSTGTWVVVTLDVIASGEQRTFSEMEMRSTSGRTYSGGDVAASCAAAQPDVPLECSVAFEVADEDVPGLVLAVPAESQPGSPADDLALIDLGIASDDPLATTPQPAIDVVNLAVPGAGAR